MYITCYIYPFMWNHVYCSNVYYIQIHFCSRVAELALDCEAYFVPKEMLLNQIVNTGFTRVKVNSETVFFYPCDRQMQPLLQRYMTGYKKHLL